MSNLRQNMYHYYRIFLREEKHEKYFTSIEIQEGDSLWSIAEDNMTEEYASVKDYIKEVKRMNHLSSDQLTKGCYIVIPHYTVD